MRVFGWIERKGGFAGGARLLLAAASAESETTRRIGANGACALVRVDLPDLSWCEEPDGSFAVVDGEVYNLHELTGPAGTHRQAAPAAVVLDLYRREGPGGLARVNGTAAVTLWDAPRRHLAIARDRWGLGSCFWLEQERAVLFSSETLSLIRSDARTELDVAALDRFLAGGFISAPWTSLAHIRKVPAAHILTVGQDGIALARYWRPSGQPKLRMPPPERSQRIETLLHQAIARRLPGRAKAGLMLSGGIDSMFLAALLAKRFGVAVETFTYRYDAYEGKFNESQRAAEAARACGLPHREMVVGPEDISRDIGRILIDHNGPLSYGAHSAILRDVAGAGARVVYSGQGNGTLYPSPAERLGLALRHLALPHAELARVIQSRLGRAGRTAEVAAYVEKVAATGLNWRFHAPLTPDQIRRDLYVDPGRMERAREASAALHAGALAEFAEEEDADRLSAALHRLYTADGTLTWTSCFARAHGLAPRCPYYDNDYVDFLYRVPRQRHKRELRELAAKLLPRHLAFAPKLGQTLPITFWFRGPLLPFLRERLAAERLRDGGLFRPEQVADLQQRHVAGASHGWTLWNVLVLTEWQEIVRREAGRFLHDSPSAAAFPRAAAR